MRTIVVIILSALSACSVGGESVPGTDPGSVENLATTGPAPLPTQINGGPFEGVWQACNDETPPQECSRYVLLQRGGRLCGTWYYVATGAGYVGRVMGRTQSGVRAERTHVCGRPGSETRTECADGWDRIAKPLLLCEGKLGDLDGAQGACDADFDRLVNAEVELRALSAETWIADCLAGKVLP